MKIIFGKPQSLNNGMYFIISYFVLFVYFVVNNPS